MVEVEMEDMMLARVYEGSQKKPKAWVSSISGNDS